jgi:hypothetical protein
MILYFTSRYFTGTLAGDPGSRHIFSGTCIFCDTFPLRGKTVWGSWEKIPQYPTSSLILVFRKTGHRQDLVSTEESCTQILGAHLSKKGTCSCYYERLAFFSSFYGSCLSFCLSFLRSFCLILPVFCVFFVSFRLPFCLSFCFLLSAFLSVFCFLVSLSVCPSICLSVCLSVFFLSVYLFFFLYFFLSFCLFSAYLCVCNFL